MDKIVELNESRMQQVAAEQGNVVYEYKYEEAVKKADVEMSLKIAKGIFVQRQSMAKETDDTEAREKILLLDSLYADYAKDHPQTFELLTDLQDGSRHLEMLVRLATFKSNADAQGIPYNDSFGQVSSFLMNACKK